MKLSDYISGSRSGEEANRIERQAMRDPFLHEALDGYERVPHDSVRALKELQQEIRKRTVNRRKYVVIWSSVASILIFIMAGGYFLFKVTDEHSLTDLVSKEQTPVPPQKEMQDTVSVETPVQSRPITTVIETDTIKVYISPVETEKPALAKQEENKVKTEPTYDFVGDAKVHIQVAGTGKVFGLVIDEVGEPLIGASVVIKGTTSGTITDFDGYFELNTNPGDELQISYIGYQTLNVPVKEGSMQIAMREDSQSLDEVVVTGYGPQKKASISGSVSHVKAEKIKKRKTPKKSKPAGGYKSFKQYIEENKSYTGKGKVVLVFLIDDSGRPENIRVKSSTNEEATEDAIDLLENGPDWIKGRSNKEVKFTFRFQE